MKNPVITKNIISMLAVCTLAACGQSASIDKPDTNAAEATLPEIGEEVSAADNMNEPGIDEADARLADARNAALTNPEWISVPNLPDEWSGLYQKDCIIGGPEDSHFFEYQNSGNNTAYYFTYITSPPSVNKKPKAIVYPVTYKVWQNENRPEHYLLFAQDSFSQVLLEEGWVRGLYQTLDGQPWDSSEHWQTKYRETDVVRWAVNVDERKDYGSHPPCDQKLGQPWTGQVFKTQSGQSLTLQKVMTGL